MATTFEQMAIQIAEFGLHKSLTQESIDKLKSGELELISESGEQTEEGLKLIEAIEQYQKAEEVIKQFVKKYK